MEAQQGNFVKHKKYNVFHKRVSHTSEWRTDASKRVHQFQTTMPPPPDILSTDPEGRIALAILAIQLGQIKSERATAKAYSVKPKTLGRRLRGIPS